MFASKRRPVSFGDTQIEQFVQGGEVHLPAVSCKNVGGCRQWCLCGILDRSVLGKGEHGLVHYETLRKATDEVVNSIFRVRRLLKQKRTVDAEGEPADACQPAWETPCSLCFWESSNAEIAQ